MCQFDSDEKGKAINLFTHPQADKERIMKILCKMFGHLFTDVECYFSHDDDGNPIKITFERCLLCHHVSTSEELA